MKKTAIAALLVASGCTGSSSEGNDKTSFDYTLPSLEVAAHSETMICYYLTFPIEKDVWVRALRTSQSEGGHHLAIFTSLKDAPDGTIEQCTGADEMAQIEPLLVGLEADAGIAGFDFPEGMAVRVPGGVRLAVQVHYVNASDAVLHTTDSFHLEFSDPAIVTKPVASWNTTVLSFEVPPQSSYERSYSCTTVKDMSVFTLLTHMHEWGSSITVKKGAETLLEVPEWQPAFRDHPPTRHWPMDAPLELHAGDAIDVTCRWTNDGTEPLAFPKEMCVAVGWFYPANESLTCVGQ